MQTVNEKLIAAFVRKHTDATDWLENWLAVTRAASWHTIQQVKTAFPSVDGGVKVRSGGTVTVFDVCGNKYRMIVSVIYPAQIITILELLTHAEYSKNQWKARL